MKVRKVKKRMHMCNKSDMLSVKFKKLDDNAIIPSFAHDGDIGMDLTATSVEYDKDRDMYVYHTGLACETQIGSGMFLMVRSSNRNTEAYLCNHVGLVDTATYRGEIILCFKNRTSLRQLALESRYMAFEETFSACGNIETATIAAKGAYDKSLTDEMAMSVAPYKVGDRIGQAVFIKFPKVSTSIVDELSDTERGKGGFGSSGK